MRVFLLGLSWALALLLPAPAAGRDPPSWTTPTPPFRIFGNVYYVGTAGLSAFLVTGPKGHVLIDGGLPESAPLIEASIVKLGFRPRDVRVLLINHSHFDHAGGLAALKRATGARLVASASEKADLEAGRTLERGDLDGFPSVQVDQVMEDGGQVTLGPIVLTALATPGHTRGGLSWLTTAGGKRVIFASSLTVAGQKLVGNSTYPDAADDFRRTFARLRATPADIFLNFHTDGFAMERKRAAQAAGRADAFVDPAELVRQVDSAERDFDGELARQRAAAR